MIKLSVHMPILSAKYNQWHGLMKTSYDLIFLDCKVRCSYQLCEGKNEYTDCCGSFIVDKCKYVQYTLHSGNL